MASNKCIFLYLFAGCLSIFDGFDLAVSVLGERFTGTTSDVREVGFNSWDRFASPWATEPSELGSTWA